MNKLYFTAKLLLSLFMVIAFVRYTFMYDFTSTEFLRLGYPEYLVIPLGIAKLLGIFMLWKPFNHDLTIAAYSGFFFNFVLATAARGLDHDPRLIASIMMIVFLGLSYKGYKENMPKTLAT